MIITFSKNNLKKIASDPKKCLKEFGNIRSKKILQRLSDLKTADTLEDVRHLPGKFHELGENRKGQWACHLDGNYRLIFKPHEDPIPTNEDGQYIWIEILGVEIIEVVDYH
ncbi:type II toxin-antitoxin system RelE/ParE family toxin [Sphingobacterium sp. 1.A.5]|uniref:type II toxin-antitoxin system RelE/ParE family toxin n=1 Tax=Sphingobacterium sp. 1.A.5 TaxID=2044604 RepID=UPI000C0BDB8E|nr:type II toxin-antitoxin system RelE/ParE family toxin [Sphingobacterium sp. 1.A.5]